MRTGNYFYFESFNPHDIQKFAMDVDKPVLIKISRYALMQGLLAIRNKARDNFKAVVKPAKKVYRNHRPNSYNEMVEGIRVALSDNSLDPTGIVRATDSRMADLYDAFKLKFFENGTGQRFWKTQTTQSDGTTFMRKKHRNKGKTERNSSFHKRTNGMHKTGEMPQTVFFETALNSESDEAMKTVEQIVFNGIEKWRNEA